MYVKLGGYLRLAQIDSPFDCVISYNTLSFVFTNNDLKGEGGSLPLPPT